MPTDVALTLSRLGRCGTLLALKVYRMQVDPATLHLPLLPCLDHEAMLHQLVPPHISVYLLEPSSSGIHEVAVYPARREIQIDTASTLEEFSDESHARLLATLRAEFPDCRIDVKHPSWWRGDRRVAEACRAQITLREVLLGSPSDHSRRQIERLLMVGALMEKQSRVASWGVRTSTGPILAAVGVVVYTVLGVVAPRVGLSSVAEMQYAVVGTLSAAFLYYGLKAVQLTDMANRVWKRASEYSLILAERRRIENPAPPASAAAR